MSGCDRVSHVGYRRIVLFFRGIPFGGSTLKGHVGYRRIVLFFRGIQFGGSTLNASNLTPNIQTSGIVLKRQGQVDLKIKNTETLIIYIYIVVYE